MAHGPNRLLRAKLRDRFLVTTFGQEAFEGVLVAVDDQHLVLAAAAQISTGGDRLPIDGELWLPRFDVAYLQRPTGGAL